MVASKKTPRSSMHPFVLYAVGIRRTYVVRSSIRAHVHGVDKTEKTFLHSYIWQAGRQADMSESVHPYTLRQYMQVSSIDR